MLCYNVCVVCVAGGLCSLTIDKALPEDEGQYKCRAEAAAGRAECCCMVLVDGELLSVFYTNVLVVCRDDVSSEGCSVSRR